MGSKGTPWPGEPEFDKIEPHKPFTPFELAAIRQDQQAQAVQQMMQARGMQNGGWGLQSTGLGLFGPGNPDGMYGMRK